jgi:hypothetical protein
MKSFIAIMLLSVAAVAATPKLNIKTVHGTPDEDRRKEQIERLAQQYDLKKYTITRDILVEKGAINHSAPVLTLNLRFIHDDDLALSAYTHEQAHWVLMERHRRDLPDMYQDLKKLLPNMPVEVPQGDGSERSSYFHLVVIMLEWQSMEDLTDNQRTLRVMHWKQQDHYKAIYQAVLDHREEIEKVMKRYHVRW